MSATGPGIHCPDCEGSGKDELDLDHCSRCGGIGRVAAVDCTADELDNDHRVVSEGGWRCDVCDVPVNGQTFNGYPAPGDSVRHTP